MADAPKGAKIIRQHTDGTARAWYEGHSIRYSSGYTEKPVADFDGRPAYAAAHADKPDLSRVIAAALTRPLTAPAAYFGDNGGYSETRKCRIVGATVSGHSIRAFFLDRDRVLRTVRYSITDERG